MNGAEAFLGRLLKALDEDAMEIVADGNRQIEYARRLTRERLELQKQRRRAVLGLFAAVAAGEATETKSA